MKKNILKSLIISSILALPITGFFYGFINCKDCENSISGFLGRFFIGFIESFLAIITLGKPWINEAGTTSINLRGYALLVFAVLFLIFLFYFKKKDLKTKHS